MSTNVNPILTTPHATENQWWRDPENQNAPLNASSSRQVKFF